MLCSTDVAEPTSPHIKVVIGARFRLANTTAHAGADIIVFVVVEDKKALTKLVIGANASISAWLEPGLPPFARG